MRVVANRLTRSGALKLDVPLYEGADGIRAALLRAGRTPDDDSIFFEVTQSLIPDWSVVADDQ